MRGGNEIYMGAAFDINGDYLGECWLTDDNSYHRRFYLITRIHQNTGEDELIKVLEEKDFKRNGYTLQRPPFN